MEYQNIFNDFTPKFCCWDINEVGFCVYRRKHSTLSVTEMTKVALNNLNMNPHHES